MDQDSLKKHLELSYLRKYPLSPEDDFVNSFLVACQRRDENSLKVARKILLDRANEVILHETKEVYWFSDEFSDVLQSLVDENPKLILAFELVSPSRSNYDERQAMAEKMRRLIKNAILMQPYVRWYLLKQTKQRCCLDSRFKFKLRVGLT